MDSRFEESSTDHLANSSCSSSDNADLASLEIGAYIRGSTTRS
jgi:hypothetical protein